MTTTRETMLDEMIRNVTCEGLRSAKFEDAAAVFVTYAVIQAINASRWRKAAEFVGDRALAGYAGCVERKMKLIATAVADLHAAAKRDRAEVPGTAEVEELRARLQATETATGGLVFLADRLEAAGQEGTAKAIRAANTFIDDQKRLIDALTRGANAAAESTASMHDMTQAAADGFRAGQAAAAAQMVGHG